MSKPQIIEHGESTGILPTVVPNNAITPMDMLNRAVASGADIEVLEKLMALQERYEKNQARKAFDEAVAAAKAELPSIIRNRTGHNNKKYADFHAIAREVDPIISKHGLSYRFRTTQNGQINVSCILSHKAGHYEENTLSGPADTTGSKNAIQAIGSTLTYLQRYSLVQALGLAASDDDDARATVTAGPVNDKQAGEITDLLTQTKSDVTRFLKWVGAESASDIPASKYADCIAMLKAKQQKGSAQ